ncbi:MAG: hypothetical protein A2138_26865 [Deltaproteobacteria bacterium RBG_16_71_12]|nr:MAG: hypothetical protein A2138_26865 [Deltaproteobacteria bacterium RBG_16_71_12]
MPRNTDFTKYGEMRMVAEYVAQAYPDDIVYMRLRLGSLAPDGPRPELKPEEAAMAGVFRRWADAVVITTDELIVIEASLRSDTGDPSKLVVYGRLVPHTPELREFMNRRLVLELVVSVEDPVVRMVAQELGIRCRRYEPKWFPEYLAQLHRRERRPVQTRGLLAPQEPET